MALAALYEGLRLQTGCRLDILAENTVIVEVKAAETMTGVHRAQLLTYLRLSGCGLGSLMNFDTVLFKHGLQRLVL